MAEYIDRGTSIAKLTALEVTEPNATMADAKRVLADIPAADVAQVVHGRWEYDLPTINTYGQLRCSICNWWTLDPSVDRSYSYCPNCGAKMDEGE